MRNRSIAHIFATEQLRNIMRRDPFHAIADPTRRDILGLIVSEAMTPNAIAGHFTTSRQAISKHIQILVECQLIKQELSGREIYYHVNAKKLKEVDAWLQPFRELWDERFNQLDKVLKNLKK